MFISPVCIRHLVPSLAVLAALPLAAVEPDDDEQAFAVDDEIIVVSAERLPAAKGSTLQPVDVITAADSRAAGHPYQPTDLVGELPGVYLLQNGGIAGLRSLRIRGAPTDSTLVLLDGVPLADPAGINGTFNLSVLNPAGIDHTEVLRGPQSGLYGSRAIGGVVDFRALRASAEHRAQARVQAGSFTTVDGLGQVSGPIGERSGYAAGLSATRSSGISARTTDANGDPENFEEDAFQRLGAYARFEHHPSDEIELFLALDSMLAETEIDSFGDPDDDQLETEWGVHRLHAGARWSDHEDDRFALAADLALTIHDREQPNASFGSKAWDGRDLYGRVTGRWTFSERFRLAGGLDLRQEYAETEQVGGGTAIDESAERVGLWLRATTSGDFYQVAGTLRHDFHSEEGAATTWQLQARVDLLEERLQLHGSVGTTFLAPSLFQLYADSFGNSELEPEEGLGAALGYRAQLAERVEFAQTWFRTAFDQRIGFTTAYVNTDRSQYLHGLETELALAPSEDLPVRIAFSHTWMDFAHAGDLERRQPANMLRAEGRWFAPHDVQVRLALSSIDQRSDGTGVTLAAYTLLDAAVHWRIDETWAVFARGENLTDEDYELVDGFATPGIGGYLGAGARW